MSEAGADPDAIAYIIEAFLSDASDLVPVDRGQATIRKWLQHERVLALPEQARKDLAASATMLMADLMLAQPSASGSTAFDRLAKKRGVLAGPEAAVLSALRAARYRLLRGTGEAAVPTTWVDVVSGQTLRIATADLVFLEPGTHIFGRMAIMPDGIGYAAGGITPLDSDACGVALAHPACRNMSAAANARWAEAVFVHMVRHGTLNVPDLKLDEDNDNLAPEFDNPFSRLVTQWVALDGREPDADLLQRTRQFASLDAVLAGLMALLGARELGARDIAHRSVAAGMQRMVLVVLETVARREAIGSKGLTFDDISSAITADSMPAHLRPGVAALFKSLRAMVGAAAAPAGLDDAALASVMQRIQGLRAKTVDQGCTEPEALAAAEKVAELLDRYGLSLGDVDFRAQACAGAAVQTARRRVAPIDTCVPTIAAFFGCRVWTEHAKGEPFRYMFFGLRADVAAAQYLYEMVERTFATETDAFRAGEIYADSEGERRTATTSFQTGLATGICTKLAAMRAARAEQQRSTSGRDLVPMKDAILDDAVDKLGLKLEVRTLSRARSVLSSAYEAGEEAGGRFTYAPGIHQAA